MSYGGHCNELYTDSSALTPSSLSSLSSLPSLPSSSHPQEQYTSEGVEWEVVEVQGNSPTLQAFQQVKL